MGRNYPKTLTHLRHWELTWMTVERLSQLQSEAVMWWRHLRNVICASEWQQIRVKRTEVKGSFVLVGTRGRTWEGLWRGRRESWCDLMTDSMRKVETGLRMTSRLRRLGGEGSPTRMGALEEEHELRACYIWLFGWFHRRWEIYVVGGDMRSQSGFIYLQGII